MIISALNKNEVISNSAINRLPSFLVISVVKDRKLDKFGATHTINSAKEDAVKRIMAETKDGVDVSIEAVGLPDTFNICQNIVRPGGHLANVGVHGKKVDLQIQELWIKNITITTGLVNTNTTPMLLKTVTSGKLEPAKLITHHFTLDGIMEAYKVFGNASKENAMKVYH